MGLGSVCRAALTKDIPNVIAVNAVAVRLGMTGAAASSISKNVIFHGAPSGMVVECGPMGRDGNVGGVQFLVASPSLSGALRCRSPAFGSA